jgi:hypothetical protein
MEPLRRVVEMRKKFRDAVGEKKLENGTKLDGGLRRHDAVFFFLCVPACCHLQKTLILSSQHFTELQSSARVFALGATGNLAIMHASICFSRLNDQVFHTRAIGAWAMLRLRRLT